MMLKQKAVWTLAAVAAAFTLAACGGGSKTETAAASGDGGAAAAKTYVVATDAAYAPFEYTESGEVLGFSKDVLEAIGAKEGLQFKFVNTPWEGIFATLGKGDADVVSSSVTITDERKQSMDFSDPYFEATQMIVTGTKGSDVKSFADLAKRRVSVQNGTTGDLVMQKLQGKDSTNIKRFDQMPLAMKELLNGGVEAVVGDNGVIQNFVNNNPDVKLRTLVDDGFEKEFYGFAIRKGRDDDLLAKLNAGLAAIKADGTYDRIYAKWFNEVPSSGAPPAPAAVAPASAVSATQ